MVFFRVLSSKRISGFRVFSIAAVLLATSFYALADETGKEHAHEASESHKANVEKMLELMGVPAQVNQAAEATMEIYSAKITDENVDALTKELVRAYQKDLRNIVNSVISWAAIKPNYINTYSSLLPAEDVEETLSFFDSRAGKKYLSSQTEALMILQGVNNHLVQEDMLPRLSELAKQFQQGITKINTSKSSKNNND